MADALVTLSPRRRWADPQELKVIAVRPIALPKAQQFLGTPADVARYWESAIVPSVFFEGIRETCFVIALTVRLRVIGHYLVGTGTLDCVSVHARDVYRIAILANAHSIVLVHNHPSGEPAPSSGDIRITRDMVQAGRLLNIELRDHVIIGANASASLREQGHCAF